MVAGQALLRAGLPLRLVELNALEQGSAELYKGSWYDLTNETFRASWMEFARALVQGDILISDLYSNTQVMTGETLAGLGSSAAILYYNDFVTYPDNTTEPTDLLLAPLPHAAGTATPLMPQAGVGLCAFKTTDQKAEAAAVFLRWLTEQQRNLEFAADTGYMPVSSAAFDAIADYPFEQQSYQRLYDVYNEMRIQNTPCPNRASWDTTPRPKPCTTACASARRTIPSALRTAKRWKPLPRKHGSCCVTMPEPAAQPERRDFDALC